MNKRLAAYLYRTVLNIVPCIRGGGGRVVELASDFSYMRVRLPLSLRTRNVVGTIFGGSMYASIDPMFMLMLMRILGKDYVVWDKGCTIRFKRPGDTTLYADFYITPQMLEEVRETLAREREGTFTWKVEYKDKNGLVYADFDKVLYVATKAHYKEKLQAKDRVKRDRDKAKREVKGRQGSGKRGLRTVKAG